MRSWYLGLVLAAGCYQPAIEPACSVTCDYRGAQACPGDQVCQSDGRCHAPGGACDPSPDADGPADIAPIDLPITGPYCFGKTMGAGLFRYCVQTLSDQDLALPSFISTSSCQPVNQNSTEVPSVCVTYARNITVDSAGTRVEGPMPLVLVATETITINGVLDAASHVTGMPGAGANPSGCGPVVAAQPSTGGGKGGGAGGTAQGAGGTGGSAGSDGTGARPKTPVPPDVIRGGCSGDRGVTPNPCTAGRGGGAMYLIAGSSVTIGMNGKINASGSGASAAGTSGCGGGAGGMIGFDTRQIVNDGIVMTNGGGGSSGANGTPTAGNDPSSPLTGGAGGGNIAGGGGGGGGALSALNGLPGMGVSSMLHGGGGGGGVGWIVVYGGASLTFDPNHVSPPPSSP